MITNPTIRKRRIVTAVAVTVVGAALFSGCSTAGGEHPAEHATEFSYLGYGGDEVVGKTLTTLSQTSCSAENKAQPLKLTTAPSASYDQKLQLLAGQDALPSMTRSAGTPDAMKQLIKAGKLEDVGKALESKGASDVILPAAKSFMQNVYDTQGVYVLPTEFNVEGIWYNKALFQANGIDVPTTWTQLMDDSAKLKANSVQPITTDGKDGWPVSRLIGNYIFRDLGTDAMKKVADGQAKLTDPEYVRAADAVAKLGQNGYFGDSVGSIDYNTMMNTFLTGKAAMMYMGSWALSNFNDATQNQIGVDNIGFMPFPAVANGKGSIDDLPVNLGTPAMMSSKTFDSASGDWLKCIGEHYGDVALKDSNVISGFKVTEQPSDLPPLTALVQKKVASTTTTVLWFEALFGAKESALASTNAAPLITGSLTAQQYMDQLQATP